jgi:hypothetical protein
MSARGEVVSFTGSPYPPLLSNTTSEVAGSGVDHRVVNLNMWIKFHSVGGDALYIVTGLTKSPNTPVGAISITIPNDVTEWSQLILPYKYIDPLNVPDTMNVAFTITGKPGPNANIGSWFEVDDIEYNDVPSTVGIQGAGVLNVSIFPNPVHESSTIHLSLAEHSVVSASIYDVAGRKLEELIEGSYDQGSYLIPFECAGFSSGMYYLRINASGKTTIVSLVVAN